MQPLFGAKERLAQDELMEGKLPEDTIFTAVNSYWPNCVFKKNYATNVQQEAEMLRSLSHPNIVCAVGVLKTSETFNQAPAAYLALQRLGPSLDTIKG